MATFIHSSVNPVLISIWSPTQKKTVQITWDTGSTVLGIVHLSKDGLDQGIFDGGPSGRRSNTTTPGVPEIEIELGKTYDFQLKAATMLAPVLATLRLKGEEKLGTTVVLATKFLQEMLPASQHIFGLHVFPGIDSVRIKFRTRQASTGFVEIKNENRPHPVAVALLPAGNHVHDVLIAPHGNFGTPHPLEQDTNHSFRIVATALPGSKIPGDKTVTGLFRTGGRTAQVFFDRILVHEDSDPGFLLGGGDFEFYFGAGDVDTEANLGNEEIYGRESIESGEFRDVNRVVTVPSAPVRLWTQVHAYEDDTVFLEFRPTQVTSFASPGSTCGAGSDGPEATVTQHFDFSDLTDGIEETRFEMSNHSCPIHFTVTGRVRFEAHSGALLQPFIKRSAPRSPVPRVATLLNAGDRVIVGAGSGIAHSVRVAPGGAAFVATSSRKPAARVDRWTRIGGEVEGPLTVVASGADRLSLFTLGADGAVAHKSWSRDVPSNDQWEPLGGAFVGPLAAAVAPDGRIEIFGLGRDGSVFHRTLNAAEGGRAASDWEVIGEGVGGSLTAFSSPRGVSVVALGRGGEVLHKLRRGNDWRPAGREWQSLGAAPAGPLSAELVEDDIAVLAVLAEDETVHLLPWRNYPDTPPVDGWQRVGTINSLLDARLSLIEPAIEKGTRGDTSLGNKAT
jgi:hypothetical protein